MALWKKLLVKEGGKKWRKNRTSVCTKVTFDSQIKIVFSTESPRRPNIRLVSLSMVTLGAFKIFQNVNRGYNKKRCYSSLTCHS